MILEDEKLGKCDVVVYVDSFSSVDSYLESGEKEDGTKLTDEELDYLEEEFSGEIQEYSYRNGSRNHN